MTHVIGLGDLPWWRRSPIFPYNSQPKPEDKGPLDNPRVWRRKTLKATDGLDLSDDLLRAEWSPNGDFIVRFGTKRSGELILSRMVTLDNKEQLCRLAGLPALTYAVR